jgi:hypothetical protein
MKLDIGPEAAVLASAFVPFTSEEFLLTLTNRGIYGRAVKDYELLTPPLALSVEEGRLAVDLGDARVLLDRKIAESRCSCPSKTTCKHVLMALFAARDAAEGAAPETETIGDFTELENIDTAELKKEVGKKIFEEAARMCADGNEAHFSIEAGMLQGYVAAYGITVYFPKTESLEGAVCKCGKKELCIHKVLAILSFLKQRGLFDPQAEESVLDLPGKSALLLLEKALAYTLSLLENGMISADQTDIERAIQFSLKFEGEKIGNLANLFRGIATDMENMLAKNAAFNPAAAFSSVSRIYNTVSLILAHQGDSEKCSLLIEKSRSSYRTVPWGNFTGFGAYPWMSRSGFTGVSVLVYYREQKTFLTYGASLPNYYEGNERFIGLKNLTGILKQEAHWDGASLNALSSGNFSLKNFKMNAGGRLSSSKETQYMAAGKTKTADAEAAAASLAGDTETGGSPWGYFGKQKGRTYRIVYAQGIEDCRYDKAAQILFFTLLDDEDSCDVLIPYSEVNVKAIQYIEELAGKDSFSPSYFICEAERRGLVPLSLVDENGIKNFYF